MIYSIKTYKFLDLSYFDIFKGLNDLNLSLHRKDSSITDLSIKFSAFQAVLASGERR